MVARSDKKNESHSQRSLSWCFRLGTYEFGSECGQPLQRGVMGRFKFVLEPTLQSNRL